MSERSRRAARKAKRDARMAGPPLQSAVYRKPMPSREVNRVASAQAVAARALPDVLIPATADRRVFTSRSRPALRNLDPVFVAPPQPARAALPERIQRKPAAPLSKLEPAPAGDLAGKCRPSDNRSKGGGGSGRSFHLWKKNGC